MSSMLWLLIDMASLGVNVAPPPEPTPIVQPAIVQVAQVEEEEAPLGIHGIVGVYEVICVGPEGSLDNPLTEEYEPGRAIMRYRGSDPAVLRSPNCELINE